MADHNINFFFKRNGAFIKSGVYGGELLCDLDCKGT